MSNENIIYLVLILMLVHLFIGMPLFTVFGLGSLSLILLLDVYSVAIFGEVPFTAMDNWALLAMPLFILTGDIVSTGKIAQQFIDLGKAAVGWIRGGLGYATLCGCFFFAGTSGSNSADTAAIARIMNEPLKEAKYDPSYAAALAAAGGTLGIIVPPSLIFIIYGVTTSTSVSELFLSGLVVGFVLLGALFFAHFITCRVTKWSGNEKHPFSAKVLLQSAWGARFGLAAPLIILCGIYSGIFTPTEAAAVAVVYCLLAELLLTRGIKINQIPTLLQRSGRITGIIGPIIAFSILFSEVLSILRIPEKITSILASFANTPNEILIVAMILLLFFGLFMEAIAIIILTMPVLIPLVSSMNIDPVHFGMVVVCSITIGFITPPVGINLFAASAITKQPYINISIKCWIFTVSLILATLIISFFPKIALWHRFI
jgi:C4-dicarboxylate transporter DctM subunit